MAKRPISYGFRDKCPFPSKIPKFSNPRLFCSPAEGFSFELGTGAGGQRTRMVAQPVRGRSLTISSAVWIQSTNVTDGLTDGHKTALTYSVARIKWWPAHCGCDTLMDLENIFEANRCLIFLQFSSMIIISANVKVHIKIQIIK